MIPAFICVYSLLLLSMGSEELLHEHHLLQKNATRKVVPSSDEKPMGRFPCGHQVTFLHLVDIIALDSGRLFDIYHILVEGMCCNQTRLD